MTVLLLTQSTSYLCDMPTPCLMSVSNILSAAGQFPLLLLLTMYVI